MKYAVQSEHFPNAIHVGILDKTERAFIDTEEATDMTLAAVAQYTRDNHSGELEVDFPYLSLTLQVKVSPLADEPESSEETPAAVDTDGTPKDLPPASAPGFPGTGVMTARDLDTTTPADDELVMGELGRSASAWFANSVVLKKHQATILAALDRAASSESSEWAAAAEAIRQVQGSSENPVP